MGNRITIHLDNRGPAAEWAAASARSLVTGRMHFTRTGEPGLVDGVVQRVAEEIYGDVPATPETTRAAEWSLSLVAALVHVAVQLLDGWAHADEVAHDVLLQTLFAVLEREGITF